MVPGHELDTTVSLDKKPLTPARLTSATLWPHPMETYRQAAESLNGIEAAHVGDAFESRLRRL